MVLFDYRNIGMGMDNDARIEPLKEILPETNFLSGQLLMVDKPIGWTSFDVVNKLRFALKKRLGLKKIKVGHAGTLDPLATGLLLIATGKMTKRLQTLQDMYKVYEGTLRFGASTPTYDSEMPPDRIFELSSLEPGEIIAKSGQFQGEIEQVPPRFSAIKKDGQAAYKYARKGQNVKLEARKVTVYEFDIRLTEWPEFDFNIKCSKGTYIRSLVHDLGVACDNGAYRTRLIRTHIGTYALKDAWSLEQLVERINS